MLIDFYSCIVQQLSKWEPSAPKMIQPIEAEEPAIIEMPTPITVEAIETSEEINT